MNDMWNLEKFWYWCKNV